MGRLLLCLEFADIKPSCFEIPSAGFCPLAFILMIVKVSLRKCNLLSYSVSSIMEMCSKTRAASIIVYVKVAILMARTQVRGGV